MANEHRAANAAAKVAKADVDDGRGEIAGDMTDKLSVSRPRRRSGRSARTDAPWHPDASDRAQTSGRPESSVHPGATGRPAVPARTETSGLSGASPRSARANRSATSGRSKTASCGVPARPVRSPKDRKPFLGWTWREYALQLSVVIIGIVVTFAGSGMIERSRQARDVRAAMMLVHSELETNRMKIQEVWDWIQCEADAYRILTANRHDLKGIPQDTMDSFMPVFGRVLSFHPRQDAFDVLKNSGLMASIRDKDFLLTITQGYATLDELEENVGMYFNLKVTAQGDMSKAFSRSQREIYYSGDMYGMWDCILSVPSSYDFVLSAPYFFPEGYTEGLLADVDRSIRAIEAKYKLDKKPTDD